MDRAHTKGPWALDGHNMSSVLKCVVPKGDPKARHLTGDYDIIARCFSDNWRNDARLIAAAPDMYEHGRELAEAAAHYAKLIQVENFDRGDIAVHRAYERLRLALNQHAAAIAKAEGRANLADATPNSSPAQEG